VELGDERGYREGHASVVELARVPMPLRSPHVLDARTGTLTFVEGSRLGVVRGLHAACPRPVRGPDVRLPWAAEVLALALVDGIVYAGGRAWGLFLGWVDPEAEGPRFQRVETPQAAIGKGIDGFALHGRRLVAVDDIVLPRYLIVLDVSDARAPRLLETLDLRAHSSAECVRSVAANTRAMALLSTSANRGRQAVHVSLLELSTLRERAVFHGRPRDSLRAHDVPVVDFRSVALSEDALLIAAGTQGVGVIDLAPLLSGAGGDPKVIAVEEVRFVPVAEGQVVEVVPADERHAFAVVSRKGLLQRSLDSVLVHVR
jgi:hypothetical protein